MNSRLVRLEQTKQGALGTLLMDEVIFCFFLHPDITDKHFQLPANTPEYPSYICTRFNSPKHGTTFIISRPDTPGFVDKHSYLEFHAGNDEDDTEGCTIVGATTGKLKGQRAVLNSGNTYKAFLEYTKNVNSFTLKVEDCYK